MPGLGFVSDCFFRRGMIFCEKFRHLKDWYFGLIPACRDPTMSAVEAAQECWGTQSCLGQKQWFFDVFWFCMSIGALFFWVGLAASKKRNIKNYNK